MSQINQSALVSFSAKQMYQLINDVESYPQFLPGCVGSRILSVDDHEMTAVIEVAKAGINKTFTTRNILQDNRSIVLNLVEGPFRQFNGEWRFTPLSARSCKVEFKLDFQFTNKLLELAFGKIFKELMGGLLYAFTERAKEIYHV